MTTDEALEALRCAAIWNGCTCDREPHDNIGGHVWRNMLDGKLVAPDLWPDRVKLAALRPDVLRGFFRDRGWSIHMDDSREQPRDPFEELAAALDATEAER